MSQSAPQDQGIFEIRCIDIQGPFEPDGCLNLVPFGTKPTSSYNPWWEVSGAYGCRKCSMFGMHPRQSSNLPYPRLEHLKVLRTHFSSVFGTSQPCCRKQQYTPSKLNVASNLQHSSIIYPYSHDSQLFFPIYIKTTEHPADTFFRISNARNTSVPIPPRSETGSIPPSRLQYPDHMYRPRPAPVVPSNLSLPPKQKKLSLSDQILINPPPKPSKQDREIYNLATTFLIHPSMVSFAARVSPPRQYSPDYIIHAQMPHHEIIQPESPIPL